MQEWLEINRGKLVFIIISFVSMLCLSALPQQVFANGMIELEVKTGLEGEYKQGFWTPVEVTVINNSGKDIEGYVSIKAQVDYTNPVNIAAGATKKVAMVIPGHSINSTTEVQFFEGKKELAKEKVKGKNLSDDTFLIGVLANDKNTGNYLGSMPKNLFPNPVRLINLDMEDIPSFALPIQALDLLVINDYSIDQLSQQQIGAITEWTTNGGILLLSGGSHIEKASLLLQELTTIEIESSTTLTTLESMLNSGKDLEMNQPLTVSKAKNGKGKILFQEDQIPLFIMEKAGSGSVLYAAYDIAAEPLASWSGNGEFWAKLLTRVLKENTSSWNTSYFDAFWGLQNAADRIPSLKLPNVSTLAIIFALYILVVGPILYFVLKKMNRREWTWVMVPVCAALLSIAIFIFGSMERTNEVLAHNVSYVELNKQGGGQLTAISAMFVPKGGDYKLHFADRSVVSPTLNMYNHNDNQNAKTTITFEDTEIVYQNVEFWSMRKTNVRKFLSNVGIVESNLAYQNGKLVGTITNQTNYGLHDVKILSGQYVQDIPQLKAGETVEVEVNYNINPSGFPQGSGYPTHLLYPQSPGRTEQTRESMIVDILNRHNYTSSNIQAYSQQPLMMQVTLIGWTEESLIDFTIGGKKPKAENLALIKTELEVNPVTDGTVYYPAGTFYAYQTDSTSVRDYVEDGFLMSKGEVVFEFHISEEEYQMNVDKIQLYTWSNDSKSFDKQVYNWKTEAYESYDDVFEKNKLSGDKVNTYLSEQGVLRIQFSHDEDSFIHLGHPAISVEGKVINQ